VAFFGKRGVAFFGKKGGGFFFSLFMSLGELVEDCWVEAGERVGKGESDGVRWLGIGGGIEWNKELGRGATDKEVCGDVEALGVGGSGEPPL
jgi:hypothetical protein